MIDWLTLEVPRAKTNMGKTAFSFCAAQTWNTLQHRLKLNALIPIGQFKTMNLNYSASECNCL